MHREGNQFEKSHHRTFEDLKQTNREGIVFWYARDLESALDYSRWGKFKKVIDKAKVACENSGQVVGDHFHLMVKMVKIGSSAHREIEDYELSRYACYLIVQNGDSSKPVIANGQTYQKCEKSRLEDGREFNSER